MSDLTKMRLFSILEKASQGVTNEEMRTAYGGFKEQIRSICQFHSPKWMLTQVLCRMLINHIKW